MPDMVIDKPAPLPAVTAGCTSFLPRGVEFFTVARNNTRRAFAPPADRRRPDACPVAPRELYCTLVHIRRVQGMEPIAFPLLAEPIRAAHLRAVEAARRSLKHAKRAGELLLKAKESIPFGLFEEWVVQNCGFTPRTARTYLRIARSVRREPAPPDETSCRQALRRLSARPGPQPPRRPRPGPGAVA